MPLYREPRMCVGLKYACHSPLFLHPGQEPSFLSLLNTIYTHIYSLSPPPCFLCFKSVNCTTGVTSPSPPWPFPLTHTTVLYTNIDPPHPSNPCSGVLILILMRDSSRISILKYRAGINSASKSRLHSTTYARGVQGNFLKLWWKASKQWRALRLRSDSQYTHFLLIP